MSRWETARRAAWAKYGERHSRSIVRADFVAATWPVWVAVAVVGAAVWAANELEPGAVVSWFVAHWPVTLILGVVTLILWRQFTRKPWE